MLATPQLTYQLIAVVVGHNLWENAKPELHLSLPQSVALMEKLLQRFQSQAPSNALVASQVAYMQQRLLRLLNG
jgi:hypothetical protein